MERSGVDAIAQAGRVRAIGEDVAEMASATGAGDLGASHAMAAVFVLFDVLLIKRIVKAGPAATGVEFGFRWKEFEATGSAEIYAGSLGFRVLSGVGTLGALLTQNTVLFRSKRATPFFIRFANLIHGSPILLPPLYLGLP
jgi:hypothetical protein